MQDRMTRFALAVLALLVFSSGIHAQTSVLPEASKNPETATPDRTPNLTGPWGPRGANHRDPGEAGSSWDPADPRGQAPQQIPMTPWAAEKFKQMRPPFGVNQTFDATNDPVQKYCDPPGASRIYFYPWEFTFVQTPDVVYILYEFTRVWRSVAMNQSHPKDLDPTWLGDSIGKYEGDSLVIDTIGFNDKTWLDNVGHPHSDALHLVERFRRIDNDTLELSVTIDDPKAYIKTFTGRKLFSRASSPMGEGICSASEMESFQKEIIDPTTKPSVK